MPGNRTMGERPEVWEFATVESVTSAVWLLSGEDDFADGYVPLSNVAAFLGVGIQEASTAAVWARRRGLLEARYVAPGDTHWGLTERGLEWCVSKDVEEAPDG